MWTARKGHAEEIAALVSETIVSLAAATHAILSRKSSKNER